MKYRLLSDEDQKSILEAEVRSLETQHYALVRDFTTEPMTVVNEDGEAPEDALARGREELKADVESRLATLYQELDGLEDTPNKPEPVIGSDPPGTPFPEEENDADEG